MPYSALLAEVEQLQAVGERLEGLSDRFAPVGSELLVIAGNVRNVATILAVLVATKLAHRKAD
jgi:hypothetical protein